MTDRPNDRPDDGPARTLGDLVVPRRPADVPYEDGADHDARALLTENGYTTDPGELMEVLDSDLDVLRAAAARTLGAQREHDAVDSLARLASDGTVEETVRVQAAYALARMDVPRGREVLVALLDLPFEASPAPSQAAGALARLGDPRGFSVVSAALDSPNRVTAMVACKQLYAFVPLHGDLLPDDSGVDRVDAYDLFERALERPEAAVAEEARVQLEAVDGDRADALLEAYPPR